MDKTQMKIKARLAELAVVRQQAVDQLARDAQQRANAVLAPVDSVIAELTELLPKETSTSTEAKSNEE